VWDLNADNIIWSDNLCRIHGLKPQEFDNRFDTVMSFTHLDDLTMVQKKIQILLDEKKPLDFEYRIITRDGVEKNLLGYQQLIFDNEGNVVQMVGILQDITKRKQTEVEFKRVFNLSPDLIGVGKLNGYFTKVNSSFKQMLGYKDEEFLAKPFIEFVHDEDVEITLAALDEAINGKRNLLIENRYRCKDGSYKWIEWHVFVLVEDSIFYTTGRNVTERNQREKEYVQQERLAAVGQLAAGIAHDFNNVLTGIVLHSELLKMSSNLSEKDMEGIDIIKHQGMHAAKLIRQILDFSRHSVRDPQLLDLKLLLNEKLEFLERTTFEDIQIQLSFALGDYMVNADSTQLQQVITNLAVNAQSALPQGGTLYLSLSHLTLSADEMPPTPTMEPGKGIKFPIAVTGPGMHQMCCPISLNPFSLQKVQMMELV